MENEINPLYNILVQIFGEPTKKNHTQLQYGFDCPVCSYDIKGLNQLDGKGNLEVSLKRYQFNCWSCSETNGTHGSLRKLVKRYGNKIQLKQYLSLADEYDNQNDNDKQVYKGPLYLPKELIFFKDAANKNDLSYKESKNYLASRGISDEIIEKYNMGYCSKGKYENRIIIPSYDENGKLNYFVARSFTGQKIKYLNPNVEKMNLIINEHRINFDNSIFLTEGIFDSIALYPLENAIPLLGKTLSDYIYYTLLKKLKGNIYIILDPDAKQEMYQIYKKLHTSNLKDKVRIVDLPTSSDLSDIRRDFGLEGIRGIVKNNRKLELDDFMKYEI